MSAKCEINHSVGFELLNDLLQSLDRAIMPTLLKTCETNQCICWNKLQKTNKLQGKPFYILKLLTLNIFIYTYCIHIKYIYIYIYIAYTYSICRLETWLWANTKSSKTTNTWSDWKVHQTALCGWPSCSTNHWSALASMSHVPAP